MIEYFGIGLDIIVISGGAFAAGIALAAPTFYQKVLQRMYKPPMGDVTYIGLPDTGEGFVDMAESVEPHKCGDGAYVVTLKSGIVLPYINFNKNDPKCNCIQIATAGAGRGKPIFATCVDVHGQERGWAKDFQYIEGKVRDEVMRDIKPAIQKELIEGREFTEVYNSGKGIQGLSGGDI